LNKAGKVKVGNNASCNQRMISDTMRAAAVGLPWLESASGNDELGHLWGCGPWTLGTALIRHVKLIFSFWCEGKNTVSALVALRSTGAVCTHVKERFDPGPYASAAASDVQEVLRFDGPVAPKAEHQSHQRPRQAAEGVAFKFDISVPTAILVTFSRFQFLSMASKFSNPLGSLCVDVDSEEHRS
jgi:hypothetical protein